MMMMMQTTTKGRDEMMMLLMLRIIRGVDDGDGRVLQVAAWAAV